MALRWRRWLLRLRDDASEFVRRARRQLHTFTNVCVGAGRQLATGDPRLDNNEFFQARLKAAVEKGLGARGLEKTTSGTA